MSLAGCKRITDAGVVAICRASPRLRHLGLAGCHLLTGKTLLAAHEASPHIEVRAGHRSTSIPLHQCASA